MAVGVEVERAAGALGSALAGAEGPAAVVGPTAVMSAAEDPAAIGEGPVAGGEGPWRTRGLKV